MSNKISSATEFQGTAEQEQKLINIIQEFKNEYELNDLVIPSLQKARDIYDYLPIEVQQIIARELKVPLETVTEAARFYPDTKESAAKYSISVCMGTACYVKGAGKILTEIKSQLGLENTDRTQDGLFSIDACRCVGACSLAPLILVNDDVYGRLKVKDIEGILLKYKNMQ